MADIEKMATIVGQIVKNGRKKLGVSPILAVRYLPTEFQIKQLKKEVGELVKIQKESLRMAAKTVRKRKKQKPEIKPETNISRIGVGPNGLEKLFLDGLKKGLAE
jgi:hypothetical protein